MSPNPQIFALWSHRDLTSPSPFKNLTVYLKQQQQQQNYLQYMHPSLSAVVLCFVEKLSLKQLGNQVREGIVQDRGTVLEVQVSGTGHSLCSMPLLRVGSWQERGSSQSCPSVQITGQPLK